MKASEILIIVKFLIKKYGFILYSDTHVCVCVYAHVCVHVHLYVYIDIINFKRKFITTNTSKLTNPKTLH
jgi:hypothetical protein